uniref:Uncharacterized protein n=1 Tax=Arion vulgaris TaxID=1028688 RepID=A0A0B6XXT6_9EUPU
MATVKKKDRASKHLERRASELMMFAKDHLNKDIALKVRCFKCYQSHHKDG